MKKIVVASISVYFLIFVFITFIGLSGCKSDNPYKFRQISGETYLDQNVKSFEFAEQFEPKKQVNELCFTLSQNFDEKTFKDNSINPPILDNGIPVIFKSTVIDNQGKQYSIQKIAGIGENRICYVPQEYSEWLEISKQKVSFVKLLTHSNQSIRVLKIEWRYYNAWDFK